MRLHKTIIITFLLVHIFSYVKAQNGKLHLVDSIYLSCNEFGKYWKPNFIFQKFKNEIYAVETYSCTLHKFDLNGNCLNHFAITPNDNPLPPVTFIITDSNYYFFKDLAFWKYSLDGKPLKLFGLMKRKDGLAYEKNYYSQPVVMYDDKNKKLFLNVRIYQTGTNYLKQELKPDFYRYQTLGIYYLAEANKDTAWRSLLDPVGSIILRDSIYKQNNRFLPHLDKRFFHFFPFRNIIYSSEQATHEINIYDLNGKLISSFGVIGKNLNKEDSIHYLYTTDSVFLDKWENAQKLKEEKTKASIWYENIYLDTLSDQTYRIYSKPRFEERSVYLQVYRKKKLIHDIPVPTDFSIIVAENEFILSPGNFDKENGRISIRYYSTNPREKLKFKNKTLENKSITDEKNSMLNFDSGNLEDFIKTAKVKQKPYFIYFSAAWCGPCKILQNTTFIDSVLVDYSNLNALAFTIDIDQNKEVAKQFKIQGIPTIIFFNGSGKEVSRKTGHISVKEMKKRIEESKNL